jgi:hypothetical protein
MRSVRPRTCDTEAVDREGAIYAGTATAGGCYVLAIAAAVLWLYLVLEIVTDPGWGTVLWLVVLTIPAADFVLVAVPLSYRAELDGDALTFHQFGRTVRVRLDDVDWVGAHVRFYTIHFATRKPITVAATKQGHTFVTALVYASGRTIATDGWELADGIADHD